MSVSASLLAAIGDANIVTPFPGRGREFAEHCSVPPQPAGCAKPAVEQEGGGIARQGVINLRFLMGESS